MVYHLDELQADASAINVMLICEYARKKGIKVLLSGAVETIYLQGIGVTMPFLWNATGHGSRVLRAGLKWVG